MHLLVRTWNVFHGNTVPPARRAYLEDAIRLVTSDEPDVVCLQELPVWSLTLLERWSSMRAVPAVAEPPHLGPLPWPAGAGRVITAAHHGLLRSAFTGQANAILVAPRFRLRERESIVLNTRRFRAAQSAWLGLDVVYRLAWAARRRVCQAVRIEAGGETALVANTHAMAARDDRIPDAELLRAAAFADALAKPNEICVLAGDFNVTTKRSRTLADLQNHQWGFSEPGPGIDHVLVRGATASKHVRWRPERRRIAGRVVSDHAPIEVRVG